jgi:hypothetical protein
MKSALAGLVMLCGLATLFQQPSTAAKTQNPQAQACGVIEEALEDLRSIKAGTTRGAVETKFEPDGGLSFFDDKTQHCRYVYKKCNFIKVDVDFKLAKKSTPGSPEDVMVKISKPYLEYPAND